jgi:uncharacterized protein YggE
MLSRALTVLAGLALAGGGLVGCSASNDPQVTPATEGLTATTVTAPQDVRTITVGGMGSETGPPDHCFVDLGVSAQRPSVAEANAAASSAGEQLVSALEAAGVPAEGIQTSNLWISPVTNQYDYTQIVGYEVSLGYTVRLPDVSAVGAVLGEAVAAGGDSVRASSVRFEADPASLMDAARAAAWADVTHRAESTAELAGEPLGSVLDVHEKVLVTSSAGMMQGGEGDTAAFDIPVSPGVAGVVVLLTVTFAIGS